MNNLKIIQRAIEIQGYLWISVAGQDRKVRALVADGDGGWRTDIPSRNMDSYIHVRKPATKRYLLEDAKSILSNEAAITAEREDAGRKAAEWAMNS